MKNKKLFDYASYCVIIFLSLLFLYIGSRITSGGLVIFDREENVVAAEARIIEIIGDPASDPRMSGTFFSYSDIAFEAEIRGGEYKGKKVVGVQSMSNFQFNSVREVKAGDRIILSSLAADPGAYGSLWYFVNFHRIGKIMMLGGVFSLLLFIFGRVKGLNAILALCFTCTAVFAVFIPSLLAGFNIYATSIIVCVYSVISTIFIINGINKKSFAAIAGCLGGIALIALLTVLMSGILDLTGIISEESQYLLYIPIEKQLDLMAIIFAGILLGAIGAVMDVAMSIASALWEINVQAPGLSFGRLFKSGINIGRDVIGTMANTLVLAYIGSSLSMVLLLFYYTNSFVELINRELVIVEILQALIGSLGILLTMPLTALMSAMFYSGGRVLKELDK